MTSATTQGSSFDRSTRGSSRTGAGSKDRRLGKGLAALLGTPVDDDGNPIEEASSFDRGSSVSGSSASGSPEGKPSSIQSLELSIDEIQPNPFQPRREFNPDEIASPATCKPSSLN